MSGLKILVVEDDDLLREALSDTLQLAGYQVVLAEHGRQALEILEGAPAPASVNLVVTDVQMAVMDGHALLRNVKNNWPRLPVVLMTAYGSIEKAVSAMRDGAADYLVKPFEAEVLIEMVARLAGDAVAQSNTPVAEDRQSRQMLDLAARVAESEATVMLSGESGTGKEVIARLIHHRSARNKGPFVAINCAALPETMLESILFGYEKGAFTGAYQARAGKFEQAQGGTLLLDEISEMDVALQAKLLRVLQEREVERLGGKTSIPLDVRLLATTNRHLPAEVAAGRFREDLFYRLNVFPIHVAPLRDRPGDIVPLARRFVQEQGDAVQLSSAAESRLLGHRWPGNIRELQNVVQRAIILCRDRHIAAADICFEEGLDGKAATEGNPDLAEHQESPLESGLRDREQQMIIEALQAENGRRKETAERLGISPRTLRYKLAKLREDGVALPSMVGA